MKVLITGASGFIGHWCLKEFQNRGIEVTGLGFRTRANFEGPKLLNIDLQDEREWIKCLKHEKADALVHLAWDIAPWNNSTHTRWLHISKKLISTFFESGGSYVFTAGTSMEYEWNGMECSEDGGQFAPTTAYGRAKHELWKSCENFASARNLEYSHGRIFFVCGPGQKRDKFLPALISSLIAGKNFYCSGSYLYRDYLDARMYAKLIADLVTKRLVGDFNLSSGKSISIEKMAVEIASLVGESELLSFAKDPEIMPQDRYVVGNVEKLQQAIGYTPKFNLTTTIKDTIDHIQTYPKLT